MSEQIDYAAMAEDSVAVTLEEALAAPQIDTIIKEESKGSYDYDFNLDENKLTVYLAGGFYGDWNDKVKEALGDLCNIIDPRDWKGYAGYVGRDIEAIQESDIIFAYRQKENPAYGMVWEIGYAYGLGKDIHFFGEYEDTSIDRYFAFCRESSLEGYDSLDKMIEHVKDNIIAYNAWKEDEHDDSTAESTFDSVSEGDVRDESSTSYD